MSTSLDEVAARFLAMDSALGIQSIPTVSKRLVWSDWVSIHIPLARHSSVVCLEYDQLTNEIRQEEELPISNTWYKYLSQYGAIAKQSNYVLF